MGTRGLFALALAACLTSGLLPFVGGTPSSQSIAYHTTLGPNQFVAVRVNLSSGNDFVFDYGLRACTSVGAVARDYAGFAGWEIVNGQPSIGVLLPSEEWWVFQNGSLMQSEALGHHVAWPSSRTDNRCTGWGGGPPLSHSPGPSVIEYTLVFLSMAPQGEFWFNASWTQNVTDWDAYVGDAVALTLDDFRTGAHASALPMGPAAGALQSYHYAPAANAIGFFAPQYFTNGKSVWSCKHDGAGCPPGAFGAPPSNVIDVYSNGGDSWWFNVTAKADVNPPMYVLGLCEFPDDSYLW